MKTRPAGAEMPQADKRTDGETDMKKLTVAFRNFANAPKNWSLALWEEHGVSVEEQDNKKTVWIQVGKREEETGENCIMQSSS
jgi:DsbC/DsbD-like thiol-disulfide interchange protein